MRVSSWKRVIGIISQVFWNELVCYLLQDNVPVCICVCLSFICHLLSSCKHFTKRILTFRVVPVSPAHVGVNYRYNLLMVIKCSRITITYVLICYVKRRLSHFCLTLYVAIEFGLYHHFSK